MFDFEIIFVIAERIMDRRDLIFFALCVLIIFFVLPVGNSYAEKIALVHVCPYSRIEPNIDGKISESEWKDGVAVSGFVYGADVRLAGVQTVVYAKRSKRAVYFGFICFEPKMESLVVEDVGRDGRLWWNDNVEIFIGVDRSSERYFHFIIDAKGRQYDGVCRSSGWNGKWKSVSFRGNDRWTLEVEIPFETLGNVPKKGEIWKINYMRGRVGKGVKDDSWASQWSPCAGDYHRPEKFGNLYFGNLYDDINRIDFNELRRIYRVLFSYPGPVVRVFVGDGYYDVRYAGEPKRYYYRNCNVSISKSLRKWVKGLKGLLVSNVEARDKKRIRDVLQMYCFTEETRKADKGKLAVVEWVNREIIAERGISELSNLYWDVKLKRIRRELLE